MFATDARRFSHNIAVVLLIAVGAESIAIAQESIPADVLQKVKQASVFVKVSLGPLEYSGSGFVVQVDGESVFLVTNAHVVAKPDLQIHGLPLGLRGRDALELRRIQAAVQNLEPVVSAVFNSGTPDEQVVATQTVALDAERDLAILKVVKVRTVPTPIPLDISFRPTETTPVFTFGFPFGDSLSDSKGNPAITVGRGAISSVRLDKRGEDTVIQIDGALNPGNSGGPVVDMKGRLVGVAVATIRGSGIGFAIPPTTLERMLNGSIGKVELAPKKTNDEFEIAIKFSVLDPFRKVRQAIAICSPAETTTPVPDVSKPLEGARVELRIDDGKATGIWRVDQPKGDKAAVLVQVILVDVDAHERRMPATLHPLKSINANSSQAQGNTRRRGQFSLMRPVLEDIVRDSILTRLKLQDSVVISQALQELSQYDPGTEDGAIGPALEKLLSHADDSIRNSAAKMIGLWGSKESAPALLKLLDDSVARVRQSAMESLAIWQFADAAEPIMKRLYDVSDRQLAKQALIRLGAGAEGAVLKCLSVTELPVRIVACEILAEIGTKETALPALKPLADSEKGLIATRAKEAIDRINARAQAPLGSTLGAIVPGSRKVHIGLPMKQGTMLLTEGTMVLSDRGPAVGLGIVQTGDETMEFTYLTLTRLPGGNVTKATFSSRKKILKDRIRVTHALFLGDDEITFAHLYAPGKLPFVEEEFILHENPFAPQNGRLFLVDLSGATPVVVQKNIDLPSAGPLVAIKDEIVLELADQAINELLKSSEDVRSFMNGVKLLDAAKPE